MAMIAYILFVVSAGEMPQLTALAAYADEASCVAARDAITSTLEGSTEPQPLQCISVDSLGALAEANTFR